MGVKPGSRSFVVLFEPGACRTCRQATAMGVATIYAKTHLRIHLNRNYGVILSQFQRFLNNTHTKCVLKSNSNVSNSNFGADYIWYL